MRVHVWSRPRPRRRLPFSRGRHVLFSQGVCEGRGKGPGKKWCLHHMISGCLDIIWTDDMCGRDSFLSVRMSRMSLLVRTSQRHRATVIIEGKKRGIFIGAERQRKNFKSHGIEASAYAWLGACPRRRLSFPRGRHVLFAQGCVRRPRKKPAKEHRLNS